MQEIKGKYNTAKVFTDNVDNETIKQIITLCNEKFTEGNKIRIMPDCHAGKGCTIGTTIEIKDKVVPSMVGVDIACGMFVVNLGNVNINLKELDDIIKNEIPSGTCVRSKELKAPLGLDAIDLLLCKDNVNINRARLAIGTLGGGNHFIEIDVDENNNKYLVIHTGSRNLGKQVAEYYQDIAEKEIEQYMKNNYADIIDAKVKELKEQNKQNEIEDAIKELKQDNKVNRDLCYLSGKSFNNYMHDMYWINTYANSNRFEIAKIITDKLNVFIANDFTTLHNYIGSDMILRKGAVEAYRGKKLIIPMNMKDGSLICVGKGNSDWNYSAPHGAGRILSRSKAKQLLDLEEFKNDMSEIYSTTVNKSTLDESPRAYKPMQEIIDNIQDTVEIVNIIKPIYNFKASE